MGIWVTLNMAVLRNKKKNQFNIYSIIITKLTTCLPTHSLSMKKSQNLLKFTKRKYKFKKARRGFKTCCDRTISLKMILLATTSHKTICSVSLISRPSKATILTGNLTGTSSTCVIYLSYQFSLIQWRWTWK